MAKTQNSAKAAAKKRIVKVDSYGDAHISASLPHVAGDYMGEHWLATFALLALEA